MKEIDTLFFELIRVAIGTQVTLSRPPSACEWKELYNMAKKQSLVGICFAGLQKLYNSVNQEPSTQNPQPNSTQNPEPITQNLDELQYLTWMGMAAKIQQRNEVMNGYTRKALEYFREKGFACQVLKGQGIAKLYQVNPNDDDNLASKDSINPQPSSINLTALRQSGDIDVWLDCGRKQLFEFSRKELGKVEGLTYHHIHYDIFPEVEVEAHTYPSFLSSPKRNKALQEFCGLYKPTIGCEDAPSLAFNRVFILLHCYRHFCGHGIGLRQLLDYYFVLVASHNSNSNHKTESMMWIERMGMTKFCKATMWLMKEVFGVSDECLLCEQDEKNGRFLLEEVMRSGNFGHGDERNRISGSALKRYLYNIKRDIRTMRICPHESLWDPVFNVYQFLLTKFVWNKM